MVHTGTSLWLEVKFGILSAPGLLTLAQSALPLREDQFDSDQFHLTLLFGFAHRVCDAPQAQ